MPEKKNSLANRLLWWLFNNKWLNKPTEDIKNFINCELSALEYIASLFKMKVGLLLKDLYLKEF